MGKKGSSGATTTNTTEPWSEQKPYLSGGDVPNYVQNKDGTWSQSGTTVNPGIFSQAYSLYTNGQTAPDYYSGSSNSAISSVANSAAPTLAKQSNWTKKSLSMQANRALAGDDETGSIGNSRSAMNNITTGDALNGNTGLNALESMTTAVNPYSKTLLNNAISQQNEAIDSGYSQAGRYGSGAHENAKASAAEDLTNEFYSNAYDQQLQAAQAASTAYNQGTQQQILAAQQAQSLANQDYQDAAALSEAGAVQDEYNQNLINADIDNYDYTASQPYQSLMNYYNLISGNYGGTSSSTAKQNTSSSKLGGTLGGAATGASLGSYFGPVGSLVGGIGGGLLGLFS